MSDVRAFIQALQENLIEPLQRLPLAQLRALDTMHNQGVIDFQNAIGQLYAPPGPFTGKASDALADRLADYYAAENALTAYTSDDLSERVSKLIQFCQQVVSDLEPKLKDLQGTDPVTLAGQVFATTETGATLGGDETPAAPIVQLVIAGIVGTVVIGAQAWQEGKLWDAYDTLHHWEMNMSGLAAYPESILPASPSQLAGDVTVDLPHIPILLDGQQITLSEAEIAQQLFKEFGGAVSLDDILSIIQNNPGLSAEQYRLLLEYYRRTGKMPRNVLSVGAVGVNKQGKPAKIYFITAGDVGHMRIHSEFASLSNQQLADLLIHTITNEEPLDREHQADSDVYYYEIQVNHRWEEVAIVVSTTTPGRIVTSYIVAGS